MLLITFNLLFNKYLAGRQKNFPCFELTQTLRSELGLVSPNEQLMQGEGA